VLSVNHNNWNYKIANILVIKLDDGDKKDKWLF